MQPDSPEPRDSRTGRDESVITMLRMFYVSAAYAEAAFRHMLSAYQGLTDDQKLKVEALRRLTEESSEWIRKALGEAWSVEVGPPKRAGEMAVLIADQPIGTWHDRMVRLEDICVRGVESFRVLRQIYGQRAPELCATLLAKQMAMRDFARLELDGEGASSLAMLLRLLSPTARADLTPA